MILDYEQTRRLLKGTILEGLTNDQLKEAFIGEYPILYGSKQLDRIWNKILGSDEVEMRQLRAINSESILSRLETLSLSKGNTDISEQLKSIREHLNSLRFDYVTIKAQAETIKHLQRELLSYEMLTREQKEKIKNYQEHTEL